MEVKLDGKLFRKLKSGEKLEQGELDAVKDLIKLQDEPAKQEEKAEEPEKAEPEKAEAETKPTVEEKSAVAEKSEISEKGDAETKEPDLVLTELEILRNKIRVQDAELAKYKKSLKSGDIGVTSQPTSISEKASGTAGETPVTDLR